MKAVWDACEKAGIEPPDEVNQFFEYTTPDDNGVQIDMQHHESVSTFEDDGEAGFDVDVAKLPKDVTVVRFLNSW